MTGRIIAVCLSQSGGIPKKPRVSCVIAARGFEGDYHNRPLRWSYRRRIWVPNTDRHLLIVAQETKWDIARQVQVIAGGKSNFLAQGSLSENILVEGLGDLSKMVGGQMLALCGGKILLRVIEPAKPCKHVRAAYGLGVYKALEGRRGLYCAVHEGLKMHVRGGDSIQVVPGGEGVAGDPAPKPRPTATAAPLEFETV